MIQLALRMYHVTEDKQVLLNTAVFGFGIAMGCMISSFLFVTAMEIILKTAEGGASLANLLGGCKKHAPFENIDG